MARIDSVTAEKIRKVAALSTSPHQGEADTARRKACQMLLDNGGPSFIEMVEAALKGTKTTASAGTTSTKSTYNAQEQGYRPEEDFFEDYERRQKDKKERWEQSRGPDTSELRPTSILLNTYLMAYVTYDDQDGIINWALVLMMRAIKMTLINVRPHRYGKQIENSVGPNAWQFIGDLFDKGSFYCAALSERQIKWLIDISIRVLGACQDYSIYITQPVENFWLAYANNLAGGEDVRVLFDRHLGYILRSRTSIPRPKQTMQQSVRA